MISYWNEDGLMLIGDTYIQYKVNDKSKKLGSYIPHPKVKSVINGLLGLDRSKGRYYKIDKGELFLSDDYAIFIGSDCVEYASDSIKDTSKLTKPSNENNFNKKVNEFYSKYL